MLVLPSRLQDLDMIGRLHLRLCQIFHFCYTRTPSELIITYHTSFKHQTAVAFKYDIHWDFRDDSFLFQYFSIHQPSPFIHLLSWSVHTTGVS